MKDETVNMKGAKLLDLFGLYVEKSDDTYEQQELGGEEMSTIWTNVWKRMTKWGNKITENQVTIPKGKKKGGNLQSVTLNKAQKTSPVKGNQVRGYNEENERGE